MRNALIAVLTLVALAMLTGGGVWWVQALSAAFGILVLLTVMFLHRRLSRAFPRGSWTCHVAAALAVTIGAGNIVTGAAHSFAVVSLAMREPGYGPLQILRFTTGAMLLYSGAMNIATHRGVADGRGWAIRVGVWSGLLFWMYLMFTLPLPGSGGSVSRELVVWTFYLGWLCAAGVTSIQRDRATTLELAAVRE